MAKNKWIKSAGLGAAAIVSVAAVFWAAIGPDWRALLSDPPTNKDVLFWSTSQRDAAFRMLDEVPFVSSARRIEAGGNVRALPIGEPLDMLDFDLDAYMEAGRVSSIVIVHDGKVRIERYNLGFGPGGRWTSFSVAKSFTSTLVGAAIKDGYIESIDDPVSKYVEGLRGSAYDEVTVEQLLTMTSGVKWNEDYEDPASDVALFGQQAPEDGESSIVSYMKKLPRAHPAGEVWNYSTGETNLIGALLIEATGKPLSDYLEEKIWRPFGMEADATWLLAPDGDEISGCCIQAATRDFARMGLLALDRGVIDGQPVTPDGWFAKASTKQAETGEPAAGYGYQWWTLDDGAFQARGIFGQGIFVDPARKLVIASNGNWTTALGRAGGERDARTDFYAAVRAAIDAEGR
ncbi:MAG: serine hydrolase [Alphaproteobacteria bacterium]|nr:serine hydrolase [Alphaproteobacteria bacterium]